MPSANRTQKNTKRAKNPVSRKKTTRTSGSSFPNATADTRLALMRAAEKLMSQKGLDSVSLREVSAAAKQLNNSAVLYHFGSRDALIDAILERHSLPIHKRWGSQLDFVERQGGVGLRPLVEMLVVELVNKLDDPDGGWEYLSLCGQLLMTPHQPLIQRSVGNTPEVQRLISAMLPFYAVPSDLLPLRLERLLSTIYLSIISWRRLEKAGAPVSRATFTSELVDTVVALITQPLSKETQVVLSRSV